jgi:hypothetical protein
MAVPTYGTDLTDINLVETAGGTTSWSALGGGASGLASETDYFVQGDGCISKAGFTATTKGMIYDATTTTVASGDAIYMWIKQNNRNLMDTQANGGTQLCIGSSSTAFDRFYVDGSDSEGSDLAGWRTFAVDPTATPSATTGSPTNTNFIGAQWKILGSGSLKGNPNGIDAFRHGRELTVIDGQAADYGTFQKAANFDSATTRRWGILTPTPGALQFHGAFVMGTVATAVDFRDLGANIVVLEDEFVAAGFNEFEIRHASSNVEWTNVVISHLGTTAPAVLTLNVGTFTGEACQFSGCATTTFKSTSACTNSTWTNCEAVDAQGADLTGSSILTPNVSANTSGLIWNISQDTDGSLDNMTFTKTAGTAHHAIEFGTAIPSAASYTLRNCAFGTDFSATEGGTTGDETFHFLDTTGTITLNLVGCTGNFGYRTAGVAVTIVQDPVTLTITVRDEGGTAIQNARVLVETSDGTGPLPYQDAVTIVQSAGVATVTHTAHGLATNNYIVIRGATQNDYNKVAQITVTGANTYTYAVDSGAASPATGSPVASAAIISGLTNASGVITDTRTYSGDQPFKGRARKSSASPYYKTGDFIGTVSSSTGASANINLLDDE